MGTDGISHVKRQRLKEAHGTSHPLPKRLYTLKEASLYLGRTLWGVREMVWAGKIPVVRDGKKLFIDINDLEMYVTRHETV